MRSSLSAKPACFLLLASIIRKHDIVPGDYKFVRKNEATISAKFGVKVKLVPAKD